MPIQIDEDRKYKRYEHTDAEKRFIESKGFTPVVSSNVSAIARDKNILYIRFHHGGATYAYPKSGDLYGSMLNAPSKGKFVWNMLIRKHVPYYKASQKVFKMGVSSEREAPIDLMQQAKIENAQQAMQMLDLVAGASLTTIVPIEQPQGSIVSLLLASYINGNAA